MCGPRRNVRHVAARGALRLHVSPGGNPSGKGSNPVEIRRALSLRRSMIVLTLIPSDALSWPFIMSSRSCSGHGARVARTAIAPRLADGSFPADGQPCFGKRAIMRE